MVTNHTFDDLLELCAAARLISASQRFPIRARAKGKSTSLTIFIAGSGIMVPPGNPHHIFAIDALCGFSVDVEERHVVTDGTDTSSRHCNAIGLGADQTRRVRNRR